MSIDKYLQVLIELCDDLAWNRPTDESKLYELTQSEDVPSEINQLAESFGLMSVKVAAREYHRDQLIETLQAQNFALEEAKRILINKNNELDLNFSRTYNRNMIIGQNEEFKKQIELAFTIARRPINTLILGPTGSGKENIAKTIHFNSPRKDGPFIPVNCTAIPESLFESEMFGIDKGVATGVQERKGLIESANGGTLFLDEIADMSMANQTKLLRVLEERTITKVGTRKEQAVDFLLLSASHKDFRKLIEEGKFREDLFYRINVVEINLPSLSQRQEDILLLASNFLAKHSKNMSRQTLHLDSYAQKALSLYSWPGNIRELNNEMERVVALCESNTVSYFNLSPKIQNEVINQMNVPDEVLTPVETFEDVVDATQSVSSDLPFNLQDAEEIIVKHVLEICNNNKTKAAEMLGITREGLRKKLQKISILDDVEN